MEKLLVNGRHAGMFAKPMKKQNMEVNTRTDEDGLKWIRIDDEANPEFWLEIGPFRKLSVGG